MIAQPIANRIIAGCLIALGSISCAEYATQDDLSAVEQKVDTVEHSLQRTRRELQGSVQDTQRDVEEVAMRQAVTESAIAAMGEGFNELAIAVQDAHETSQDVYEAQQRLVSDVESRLSDFALEPMGSATAADKSYSRYVGHGRDLRQGTALPIWTLDYSGAGALIVQRDDGTQQRYGLQQAGMLLYALDDRGRATACFEQTYSSQPESDTFLATDCDNRYLLYEFTPAMDSPSPTRR